MGTELVFMLSEFQIVSTRWGVSSWGIEKGGSANIRAIVSLPTMASPSCSRRGNILKVFVREKMEGFVIVSLRVDVEILSWSFH